MEDRGCIPIAVLLRGWCRRSRGCTASQRKLGVVWVAFAYLLWGDHGVLPWGDCFAGWRWAIRPTIVCVLAGVWVAGRRWGSVVCWATACLTAPRLRVRGRSFRSI